MDAVINQQFLCQFYQAIPNCRIQVIGSEEFRSGDSFEQQLKYIDAKRNAAYSIFIVRVSLNCVEYRFDALNWNEGLADYFVA